MTMLCHVHTVPIECDYPLGLYASDLSGYDWGQRRVPPRSQLPAPNGQIIELKQWLGARRLEFLLSAVVFSPVRVGHEVSEVPARE